jgi:hypothetical protein
MKNWSKYLIRVLGALNLIYGVLGAAMLTHELVRFGSHVRNSAEFPYYRAVFDTETTFNAVFLVGLVLAGYWLIGLRRRGVILSNFVYSLTILYFMVSETLGLALSMSANKTAQAIGSSMAPESGNIGIALQVITCYPLIALIALNIAHTHMKHDSQNQGQTGRFPFF